MFAPPSPFVHPHVWLTHVCGSLRKPGDYNERTQSTQRIKPLPNVPVRPGHSEYYAKQSAMFDLTIRQMLEGRNDVMMTKHLKKFKDEEHKQLRDLEQFKMDTNQVSCLRPCDARVGVTAALPELFPPFVLTVAPLCSHRVCGRPRCRKLSTSRR